MPYVIITAGSGWRGVPGFVAEGRALAELNMWAMRMDELDGEITNPRTIAGGGRLRHARIRFPSGARHASWQRRAVLAAVEHTYGVAAHLAIRRGHVGIAVGHGASSGGRAWVDLAPLGWLRVDLPFMERLHRFREGGSAERGMTLEEMAFDGIGQLLRERHRVSRVDLYTCSVGATDDGQRLLDWMQYFWRVRVRGLRGDLHFSGHPTNPSLLGEMSVSRPPGAPANRHYGRTFVDSLITPPSLWRSSRDQRPALSGAR
ncbi:MAG: hypothetical protein SangKO_069480 [Sandaracinaceae bacterium]